MSSVSQSRPDRTTARPMVQLVDIDGTPIQAPKRPAAMSWPAWADLVSYGCGASDPELDDHRVSVTMGSALNRVLWAAERLAEKSDEDLDVESGNAPLPELEPLIDPTEPDEDHDAPDGNPHVHFAGIRPLAERRIIAPISGGSPEDPGPTAADRADFDAWLSQVDQPYPPLDQPEPARPDRYSPESLLAVRRALWGLGPDAFA